MINKFKYLLFLPILVLTVSIVQAKDTLHFSLPSTAKALSPSVYSLGKVPDGKGRDIEGFAFVHRKENQVKPGSAGGGKSSCYSFMASGAKWKTSESWVVNATNSSGLNSSFVFSNLNSNITKWETAAQNTAILGSGSLTNSLLEADIVAPDNQNEVYFAGMADPGTIGVTIVWGYFGGPPQTRQLLEWDQVYNDADYAWSSSGETGKMDFENIATHELGHTFGLADIYNTSCSTVTMYGYASFGETNKRSLESPDATGIFSLYH